MLPSAIAQFANYKHVRKFVEKHLDMQFADINQMLMMPGFNFVAANFLCDVVSGISVSLYLPGVTTKVRKGKVVPFGDGDYFRALLRQYYPWEAKERKARKQSILYQVLRCPMAHALGLHEPPPRKLGIAKGSPLTQEQLNVAASSDVRPAFIPLAIARRAKSEKWSFSVEGFWWGVFAMLRALANDANQMLKADARFLAKTYIHTRPSSVI
jgi:hypothetical protein